MTPETTSGVVAIASILTVFSVTCFAVRSASISTTHHGYIHLGNRAGTLDDGDISRTISIITQGDVSSNYKTRMLIVIGSVTAFLSSVFVLGLIIAKLDFLPRAEGGIFMSGWSLVLGQAILLARERAMVKRFNIGICIALSCATLFFGTLLTSYFLALQESRGRENHYFFYILNLVEIISAIVTAVASVSLPRQPPLYRDGKVIDAQFSSSALGRYTFSWASPLLKKARIQNSLNQLDLPELDDDTRSSSLQSGFRSSIAWSKQEQPLWYQIFNYHWRNIIKQWTLTGFESFAMMLPPLCLFKLLSLLEKRSSLENSDIDLWLWVAFLGLSKVTHLGFETWTQWTSFAIIATPIRAQLSALIFVKSMHMKDVQVVEGQPTAKGSESSNISVDGLENCEAGNFLSSRDQAADINSVRPSSDDSRNGNPLQTSDIGQRPINLLGVDVQRVCTFCGENNLLIGSLLKILLAVWFLVILLGWWSTIAGLSVPLIFHPINQIATKYYSQATEDVMKARDQKAHLINEALHGIRQIKFSSMESQWQEIIMAARVEELAAQWRAYLWAVFLMFCWLSMPILLGATALGTYACLNETLTASVAFTALAIFSSLEWTLSVVPTTITELLDGMISIGRIQKHLETKDMQQDIVDRENVGFENACIKWPSNVENDGFVLRDITLDFPRKKLSVLHGESGSGKSLLLAAIMGEAEIVSGRIYRPKTSPHKYLNDQLGSSTNWIIPSATALVAQIPWIENASLKSNILFGLPYIDSRFSKVLEACALIKDLEMLPDGVETEIGANGINLSGGQRWRITLARALYSRAGILILDDIFSAVDAHVGRHILLNALEGEISDGRTRILVTHHIQLVRPFASYVVELGTNGFIESSEVQLPTKVSKFQEKCAPTEATGSDDLRDISFAEPGLIKWEPKKFVEDENREEGRVKWEVYKTYARAFGGQVYGALTIGVFIFSSFTTLGRSYWVKVWAQHYEDIRPSESSVHSKTSQIMDNHLYFYLGIYLLISIVAAITTALKTLGVLVASIRASQKLFEDVTYNVLRAPLRWLDTTPVGRILNRFVSDFALVDSQLAGDFFWLAHGALGVITIVGAALFISIYMIVPVLILGLAALYFVNIYLDGARDMKRLEANAKSPIFEFFGSSLAGLTTIRSFEKVDDYLTRMFVLIDDYTRTSWYLLLVSRWMAFRQGALGVVFSLCVASLVVVIHGIDASLAGFVLGFALEYSTVTIMTVTQYADFELAMNSTERVVEYTKMLPEDQSGHSVAQSWPLKGRLVVKDLQVKYAPDLPLVLKGLSFTVESRERVGVVGRTGSGKSSLALSLFRFLQASSGYIEIDGVDISKIKLHSLRSRLAIIPQDPVLFSGTLRSNIDPFNQQSDSTIIDALKRVHLLDIGMDEVENGSLHDTDKTLRGQELEQTNMNIFRNLESPISRGGLNLSQGQRQLLCLARAIVKQPKILVLDEATSSVDVQTDSLIQHSIREQFSNSTLLVIAHRLSTISDFDKVLVMSDGQAVEFDTPRKLMRKRGAFWELVNESGEREAIEKQIG